MKVTGNTVLITGGATGIGFALARALVLRDNRVIVCGRRRDKLAEAKAAVPELHTKVCDVSRRGPRSELVRWVTERHGSLNVLVNNAGVQLGIDFTNGPADMDDAETEIATNLLAPLDLSALLVPHLHTKDVAAIVNITSGLAFAPLAFLPVYCATKAALHSLSLSLRHQLRNTSVRLFEIIPPMVSTDLGGRRREREGSGRCMTAEAVADGIVEAMAADRYEAALGVAAHLRSKGESLFHEMNR